MKLKMNENKDIDWIHDLVLLSKDKKLHQQREQEWINAWFT